MKTLPVLALVAASLLLAGCGNKGPLLLPSQMPEAVPMPPAAPAPDTDTPPAAPAEDAPADASAAPPPAPAAVPAPPPAPPAADSDD